MKMFFAKRIITQWVWISRFVTWFFITSPSETIACLWFAFCKDGVIVTNKSISKHDLKDPSSKTPMFCGPLCIVPLVVRVLKLLNLPYVEIIQLLYGELVSIILF